MSKFTRAQIEQAYARVRHLWKPGMHYLNAHIPSEKLKPFPGVGPIMMNATVDRVAFERVPIPNSPRPAWSIQCDGIELERVWRDISAE